MYFIFISFFVIFHGLFVTSAQTRGRERLCKKDCVKQLCKKMFFAHGVRKTASGTGSVEDVTVCVQGG